MGHPWDEKWIVGEKIGRGGQGETKHATWKEDNTVKGILKTLNKQKDPSARARMRREVANLQVLAAVGGSVPRVLDHNTGKFEETNVELFVVMTFIKGQTLKDIIEGNGPLGIDQAVQFTLSICKTVEIAHQNDIIHRDLKPDNIIVRDPAANELVIVDYGLSFNAEDDDVTVTEETFRNKFLDLPETNTQGGDRRDQRIDLTGVCAILYYCLTGGIPHHLVDADGRPPHKRPGFTLAEKQKPDSRLQDLDEFLTRGFAQQANNRFQTCAEIVARLTGMQIKPDLDLTDPFVVSAALSQKIATSHRKTQIAQLRKGGEQALDMVQQQISKYSNKLGQFKLKGQSLPGTSIPIPGECDLVTPTAHMILMNVNHHTARREVAFLVAAKDEQCVLLAFESAASEESQKPGPRGQKSWTAPVEVGWYTGDPKQISDLTVIYFKQWLVRAMTEISEQMLA